MTPREIVDGAWQAVADRDLERAVAVYEPNAELHTAVAGGVEGGGPRHGLDQITAAYTEVFETWERFDGEVLQFLDLPPHALVVLRLSARGRGSGLELERPYFQVVSFTGDRISRLMNTFEAADALEDLAAQLRLDGAAAATG